MPPFSEPDVQPGDCIEVPNVLFTRQAYGPVLTIAWWKAGYKEPNSHPTVAWLLFLGQ